MTDPATQAGMFVMQKIIQISQIDNESAARALLAKLRRGIGKKPGSMPEIWGVSMDGLPECLIGSGEIPSRGEWAVHTALTLYALHQQGKDLKKEGMNKTGEYVGGSIRKLIKVDDDEQRIKRRFDAMATSNSLEELSHHVRGLIQLMKASDIPLDYPALTKDLYYFSIPEMRDAVRLRWGRDYYRSQATKNQGDQA